MCLTRTVDCIDFTELSQQQKTELKKLKDRLEARKESLEVELALLEEGIEKLKDKLGS